MDAEGNDHRDRKHQNLLMKKSRKHQCIIDEDCFKGTCQKFEYS